jgi:hypothetical protein
VPIFKPFANKYISFDSPREALGLREATEAKLRLIAARNSG